MEILLKDNFQMKGEGECSIGQLPTGRSSLKEAEPWNILFCILQITKIKMAGVVNIKRTVIETENFIAIQCMEFTKHLPNQGKGFQAFSLPTIWI